MKLKKNRFQRFYIDDPADMQEYNDLLEDPFCTITEKEVIMEKTITTDGEGNSSTQIRPTYVVHWQERIL